LVIGSPFASLSADCDACATTPVHPPKAAWLWNRCGVPTVDVAMQLRQSALTTLAMPPAEAAVSYSLALLGRSYLSIADQILQPLEHRIHELLRQVPLYVIVSNRKTPRLPPWGEDQGALAA
jgi:hypothetical protein